MDEYRVNLTRTAARELESLPGDIGRRLLTAIQALRTEPRPPQCKKLTGSRSSYRIRVGTYRILYEILDRETAINVFAVGHRRDVFRRKR